MPTKSLEFLPKYKYILSETIQELHPMTMQTALYVCKLTGDKNVLGLLCIVELCIHAVFILSIGTDRPEQTMKTLIRCCIKLFFMLNSAEHEIFAANKYENANNSWHFHIH